MSDRGEEPRVHPDEILVVRRGPGANCSSIGSALDVLFLSAVAAGAVLAGVAAAFGKHRPPSAAPPSSSPKSEPEGGPPRTGIDPSPPSGGLSARARVEPFGAWARVDDGALVAIARPAARRLGIEGGPVWRAEAKKTGDTTNETKRKPETPAPLPSPLEVHLAVTSRCGAGCRGCYLDARPDGDEPPFDVIKERLRAVAEAGAFTVAFGGGEPLSRPDLGELGAAARALGLVPVVTTSGIGMTRERAESLRSFAQVNVSYDGEAEGYELVRGWDGARTAERAMRLLAGAGVPFGVNVVLTRSSFPRLARTLARAEELGAREAQLLRYKPAGRARGADYLAARLSNEQVRSLLPSLESIARERSLSLRIDCALVPLLSASPLDPSALARFGVLGCEAGRHLAAVRIDGLIAPCSFASPSGADVHSGFGHASDGRKDQAPEIAETPAPWERDPVLTAFRHLPDVEPCRSCSLREVCRGGCRIVAEHTGGALGPDPECPRVLAHAHERRIAERHDPG
ncbi:MAG TPA: radical SAM protein [Polyangiaceae bacterium]|nr:radical SAM protein [Polyangiaceae bacterium]